MATCRLISAHILNKKITSGLQFKREATNGMSSLKHPQLLLTLRASSPLAESFSSSSLNSPTRLRPISVLASLKVITSSVIKMS